MKKAVFFSHRECEYYPCHDMAEELNCLFCYCPLFTLGSRCGGNYAYTDKGIKTCIDCTLPHGKNGAEYIRSKFGELAKLAGEGVDPRCGGE
jgi:Zn-finger protein